MNRVGGLGPILSALILSASLPVGASGAPDPYRFFRPERRAGQREYEAMLLAAPDAKSLRAFHDLVSSEPHVAGSAGDARVVDKLQRTLQGLGLEVERQDLWLYLARPLKAELEIVSPRRLTLKLKEDVLPEDPYSGHPALDFGWNAYSGSGEVTAGVVYVNHGTKEDFARLRELGVDLRGRIALARYGGNFRGFKAKFAEAGGAAGLVIFSDPAESGYMEGPLYPEGGWVHPSEIQRGSLLTLPYPGDPLTPFEPATKEAERLDPATLALPRIPVQPIGFRAAQEILSRMSGPPVPAGWQGGLPIAYRITGGDRLKLRLKVQQERRLAETANVLATLKGARFPEERVIVGSHHDAWTFGAADPNAGTIVVLETARAFAEAARAGRPPDRTLVFANWTAEEFGLLGSTEWVEGHREELARGTVAYLDLDSAALGPDLMANASPSLKEAIAEAAGGVTRPAGAERSPLEAWIARREDPQRPGRPFIGDLGGGSDHVGFLCHLGVPSAALSARGAPGTAYHSAYDDLAWYRKVVGDDYASARLMAQEVSLLAARLANADLLPLDPAAAGVDAGRHLAELSALARHDGWEADLGRVAAAAEQFARRARGAREGWVERLGKGLLSDDDLRRLNERIRRADRLWTVPAGLPGRPWFRNLLSAPDEDSGYAPSLLPALHGPFERRERAALEGAERLYLEAFSRLEDEVPAPLDLDARVKALLAGFPGRVSLFAKNLDTGEAYGERADERVRAASTIKVPILIEAYARVEEGRAHWDDPLVLREAGKVGGAGVLRELGEGLRLTLRDAVNLMILISDNTATNLVLDVVTADAVNARMEALGLQSTRALRRIGGGGDSEAGQDPANKPFGLGVSTPREMVTLLERLEAGLVVSPSAAREMIELLKRQQYHDGIGRSLRGVPLATKPGALDHLRSDVGIVYSPRGRIAMAITCEDLPEVDYTPDNPGHLLISRLSLLLTDGLGRPAP